MAGTTTNYSFPYPTNTDIVDVAGDIQALAEDVDLTLNTQLANTVKTNTSSIISVNSSSDALRITQTGAGNALVVEDSTNPDATPFVIDTSGKVGVGLTAPSVPLHVSANTSTHHIIDMQGNSNVGVNVQYRKSRGTAASPTVVSSGDNIGQTYFYAHDGTDFQPAAAITSAVDGTPGSSDMPGRLVFWTTADGSATLTERMRITSAGNVGIGTTNPSATLHVSGTVKISGALNSPYEPLIARTITSNVMNHDINGGNVVTVSSPSANFTLNITGVSTTDNQATTVSVIVTQGATGYIPSALQIDGSVQTIKWQGGSAPTPTSSSGKIDIFSFTLTRISSTWTVYGSMLGNF